MSTNAQNEHGRRRPISSEADLEEQVARAIDASLEAAGKVEPLGEIERLTAERDAYYRTATERHLELARLRAVTDGLAKALRSVIEDARERDEDMGMMGWPEAAAAMAAYDAATGPAPAVPGEGGGG